MNSEPFTRTTIERAISREVARRRAWREEWITTLGTEKVLSVIRAFAETICFREGNVILVRNRCLAVVAPRREALQYRLVKP